MRAFHKNTQQPDVLQQNGPDETQKLIAAVDGGNDSPTFDPLYRRADVKAQLKSDQNDKCAYCERKINGDYGAVEHYRPKGGWQQNRGDQLEKPGYYWLAYEWSNLLYSCDECNTSYKMNLFPLAKPADRDIEHRDVSREQPLLVNPTTEDPGAFIGFHKEMAVPRVFDGVPSDKGRKTIEVLELNSRLSLKQARRDAFFEFKALTKLKMIVVAINDINAMSLVDFLIQSHTNEYAEFTGMYLNQVP